MTGDRLPEPRNPRGAVTENNWAELRQHTAARIALGRSGASLPTREVLAFDLAHAQARDAVLTPLDTLSLRASLESDGWTVLEARSRATDRSAYLARPDWGRRLAENSRVALTAHRAENAIDLVFVVGDGLSSSAAQRHAAPLLRAVAPMLATLTIGPIIIATQARVALADEIGEILGARIAVSVIGERPGLSSPDSLGVYLTYDPRIGRHDGERNCISNIRPEGMSYADAALQLASLTRDAISARLSGVALRFDFNKALASGALAPEKA